MGRTTHYTVLGIPPDATSAQIKRAYRDLAKLHHPDVSAAGQSSGVKFARIAEAYKTLSDPAARRAYDRSLQKPAHTAAATPGHDPRPHYTWTNIAAQGHSEAARANREEEIDELYDTFFAGASRPKPRTGARAQPPPPTGKTTRARRRAG